MIKRCSKCGVEKELSAFHVRKDRNNAPRSACKQCSHPESTISTYLYRHGISQSDVEALAMAQGGCAICRTTTPSGRGTGWHIDHDHSCEPCTSRKGSCDKCRRGILCSPCNTALGLLGDNVNVIADAASYLAHWQMEKES